MFGNEPPTQPEVETAGEQATAAPCGTSAGCGNEGSETQPESAAAMASGRVGGAPSGCGGCAPPAGGPARALRHVWKCVGMIVMVLLTLRTLKTVAARDRAG